MESRLHGRRPCKHRLRTGNPMKTSAFKSGRGSVSLLPPFPEGWYFVASQEAIERAGLLRKTWLGEQIVVWCNGNGDVCVADAFCPHLGSDMGPEVDGRVRDGCLVCPFHGFEYDITGQCVATPYAPAPRTVRLKVFETRRLSGLVFAWHGIDGRPSQWDLPEPELDGEDWSGKEYWSVRFAGHPQETTENSVDVGHLRYVHGYDSVSVAGPISVDGAWLQSCFNFRRNQTFAGIKWFKYDVSAIADIRGLGYSFVRVREHTIGMDTRLWVLATPIDGQMMEMTLVSQVQNLARPKHPVYGMRFLPVGLRTRIMNKILITAQKRDVLQDVVIWGNKQYRPRPLLCRSDGEIARFRRYCEQFYPKSDGDRGALERQED
ncbi:MAG: Rieske 2Fe-2S domain-containing protein [Gammaproteobacteria bacterium]|nr:Rieske 2Fe-2S domain-containing protein [Gammaproteobacteria bacterium]